MPDNPRALVSEACRYEPRLNATVHDFARHSGVSILPTRPYSPKDKASAESAVQVVERWLMARLRHTVLADVHAADAALSALLPSLNERRFQKIDGSRASLFASLDAPTLSALPAQCWQWATFKTVTVHIDYHVEMEGHRYSVSHSLVGLKLEARITDALVEVSTAASAWPAMPAVRAGAASRRWTNTCRLRDILTNGRDLIEHPAPAPEWVSPEHDNLRGASYFR